MESVTSVVALGSPTNAQMLTALTESSTSVEGARSSNTYINSTVLFLKVAIAYYFQARSRLSVVEDERKKRKREKRQGRTKDRKGRES